jgi:3-isopropylmalate/(R)-2-methylmalate dehydratase small subunit
MIPLHRIHGRAYPLGAKNVDTDTIIPARFLKRTTRVGMGEGAFESMRARAGNVFDDPRYAAAPILIAGDNFGCGSSREHAAWALLDMGIRVVIAPSFSDIFSGNAYKNGILTIALPQADVDLLLEAARDRPLAVDLKGQTVAEASGLRFSFEIDPFRKHCLLTGLDEISITLALEEDIARHERDRAVTKAWLDRALPRSKRQG